MAPPPRPDGWLKYTHHRLAEIQSWDSRETHAKTRGPGADSQYNPHLFQTDEQVRAIEERCILEGIVIRETANKVKKYLQVRGVIIGACSGMDTDCVFAECTSGFYHGRPISDIALRKMGVVK
jgi:hypothetical protein